MTATEWGLLILLAILWGAAMLVNFLWFTNDPNNTGRIIANPKANQTGGLVNFGIGFLNKIPVIELVIGFVVLVGVVYYFGFQKRKPYTPVVVPDDTAPVVAVVSDESVTVPAAPVVPATSPRPEASAPELPTAQPPPPEAPA
jgi:hypothetical protein